jgi:hypothetical protein
MVTISEFIFLVKFLRETNLYKTVSFIIRDFFFYHNWFPAGYYNRTNR